MNSKKFTTDCTACPRLARFLSEQRKDYPDYFARPVPAFGDSRARLCIVGLAPGMHGANATGRPFTGDHAGILLYETLHKFGFANQPNATDTDDGLQLLDCRITNAVKCLPPQNKPTATEVNTCNQWLADELNALPEPHIIIALGGIAHKAVIRALQLKQTGYSFGHLNTHKLTSGMLIDSYHCSRYNTQTKRLTTPMFEKVFKQARKHLDKADKLKSS